jgi:hypothetical protein
MTNPMKIAVGAKASQRKAFPIADRLSLAPGSSLSPLKTACVEVYAAVGVGLIVGYVIAKVVVRRDPTGKSGVLERSGTIVLNVVAVLVVIVLIAQTQLEDAMLKLVLRSCLIFIATAAFSAGVISFLMYAKSEPD